VSQPACKKAISVQSLLACKEEHNFSSLVVKHTVKTSAYRAVLRWLALSQCCFCSLLRYGTVLGAGRPKEAKLLVLKWHERQRDK